MMIMEVRLKFEGHEISLEALARNATTEVIRGIKSELVHLLTKTRTIEHSAPQQLAKEPLAVSVNETAHLLGLKPSTIRAYLLRRKILGVKIGRRIMIPMDTVRRIASEGLPGEGRMR
jgi:hypothetical protein